MKKSAPLLLISSMFLFLSGCYTQLQYTERPQQRVTDRRAPAPVDEREQEPYYPMDYKDYDTARYWDDCGCNPYAYDRGYLDGYDNAYNDLAYNRTSWGFRYNNFWGPRFRSGFGFNIAFANGPFYNSFYYDPFWNDPFYSPFAFGYGPYSRFGGIGWGSPFGLGFYGGGFYGGGYGYGYVPVRQRSSRKYGIRSTRGASRVGVSNGRRQSGSSSRVGVSRGRTTTQSNSSVGSRSGSRSRSTGSSVGRSRTRSGGASRVGRSSGSRSRGSSGSVGRSSSGRSSSGSGGSRSRGGSSRSRGGNDINDNNSRISYIGFGSTVRQRGISGGRSQNARPMRSRSRYQSRQPNRLKGGGGGFFGRIRSAFNSASLNNRTYHPRSVQRSSSSRVRSSSRSTGRRSSSSVNRSRSRSRSSSVGRSSSSSRSRSSGASRSRSSRSRGGNN